MRCPKCKAAPGSPCRSRSGAVTSAYNPAGGHQWFSYAQVAAGWILVTVIAAAVARVLSRR